MCVCVCDVWVVSVLRTAQCVCQDQSAGMWFFTCQTQSNIFTSNSKTVCHLHPVGTRIIIAGTGGAADCGMYSATENCHILLHPRDLLSVTSVKVVLHAANTEELKSPSRIFKSETRVHAFIYLFPFLKQHRLGCSSVWAEDTAKVQNSISSF